MMTAQEWITKWVSTFGYGLNEQQYKRFVYAHEHFGNFMREFVEGLFTEINYHAECKALKNGNYKLALELFDRN